MKKIKLENTVQLREALITYGKRATAPDVIRQASDVSDFMQSVLIDNSREHFTALYLDGAHNVIGYSILSIGLATSSQVHPRELFQRAIALGSCSVIIAHNHPSNNNTPSTEDYSVTAKIKEAGTVIGIRLLDHIVFSDFGYFSMQEAGKI